MYYSVKLHWKQLKPSTDELMTITKSYIIYAESIIEAEMRMCNAIPANYQDAVVEEVKQTKIVNIHIEGDTETFWLIKLMEDDDGRSKPKSYLVVLNAINLDEVNKKIKTNYSMGEVESVQKFKPIIDEDLISPEIKKKS